MTPTTSPDADTVIAVWIEAVRMAYRLAYHERRCSLTGELHRRRDQRGLDSYSTEWGTIFGCEAVLPGLADLRSTGEYCDPITMRQLAKRIAHNDYVAEIKEAA